MRFTIDELNAKADEQYEPVELDLPSGEVARFENLLRLDEDKQKRVGGLLDQVRASKAAEKSDEDQDDDAPVDITKMLAGVNEQMAFLKDWVDVMLDQPLAAEVHEVFRGDIGLYLFAFNSWMGKEGPAGEVSPSAE